MLRFAGRGVSDVGRVRPHNEDAGFVGPYLALVADGVGGAAAGEVASATTAYVVAATAMARFGEPVTDVLLDAVAAVRANLQVGVRDDPARLGMATTLTAVATYDDQVVLAHVGDSRAYRLRDGRLEQLTKDHTYVQDMVDHQRLSPDAARTHPWRNVVLRYLDSAPAAEQTDVDLDTLDHRPGDRLLLCSDGLTDLVNDATITSLLATPDPEDASAALTQAALAAGGRDNITCLVLDLVDGPVVSRDGTILGALVDPFQVVDPAAVRLPG